MLIPFSSDWPGFREVGGILPFLRVVPRPASLGPWSSSLTFCRALVPRRRAPGFRPARCSLGSVGLWFGHVLVLACPESSCPPSPGAPVCARAFRRCPTALAAPTGFSAGSLCFSVSRDGAGVPEARGPSPRRPRARPPSPSRRLFSARSWTPALCAWPRAALPAPIPPRRLFVVARRGVLGRKSPSHSLVTVRLRRRLRSGMALSQKGSFRWAHAAPALAVSDFSSTSHVDISSAHGHVHRCYTHTHSHHTHTN